MRESRPGIARQPMEGGRLDPRLDRPPHTGDTAVDEQGGEPHRRQPGRGGDVLARQAGPGLVVQDLAAGALPLLEGVRHRAQHRLDPGLLDQRELGEVGHRGWPERRQMPTHPLPQGLLGVLQVERGTLRRREERRGGGERPRLGAGGNAHQRWLRPSSLISYSTRGGTSGWYVRTTRPSRSIWRSRRVRTFGVMVPMVRWSSAKRCRPYSFSSQRSCSARPTMMPSGPRR